MTAAIANNKTFHERSSCPACKCNDSITIYGPPSTDQILRYFYNFYSHQGTFDESIMHSYAYILLECINCKLIYQKFAPSYDLLSQIYDVWINPNIALERHLALPEDFWLNQVHDVAMLKNIITRQGNKDKQKWLDFGAGWGSWALAAEAINVKCFCTELSKYRARYITTRGLSILEESRIPNSNLDLINTNAVFEHLTNPLETLYLLHKGLKTGGILKINVPYRPNYRKAAQNLDLSNVSAANFVAPLEHLNYFPRKTLISMAKLVGFEEITSGFRSRTTLVNMSGQNLITKTKKASLPFRYSFSKVLRGNYVLLKKC